MLPVGGSLLSVISGAAGQALLNRDQCAKEPHGQMCVTAAHPELWWPSNMPLLSEHACHSVLPTSFLKTTVKEVFLVADVHGLRIFLIMLKKKMRLIYVEFLG